MPAASCRLYCDPEASLRRLSAQTALYHSLHALLFSVAPICPVLTAEVLEASPNVVRDPFEDGTDLFRQCQSFKDEPLAASLAPLLALQKEVLSGGGEQRVRRCRLEIAAAGDAGARALAVLGSGASGREEDLAEVFMVPRALVTSEGRPGHATSADGNFQYLLDSSEVDNGVAFACPRCRRYTSPGEGRLCARCEDVVAGAPEAEWADSAVSSDERGINATKKL